MKYAFFSGCGVGGSPHAVDVLSRALKLASMHEAIPVIVGDLCVAPSIQSTHTIDMIEAIRLVEREDAYLIIGSGDTTCPGLASGPAAFVDKNRVLTTAKYADAIELNVIALDAVAWEERVPSLVSEKPVAAVLPRDVALERVATVMAGAAADLIVIGGQALPGELEAMGWTVISVGMLCPTDFDGSGFNAGRVLIYDADEGVYDWETIRGPRYHVVRSIGTLRSLLKAVQSIAPECHHYVQLRVQPGDTETSEAVAAEYVRELTQVNIKVALTVTPDLAATRAAAIYAATTMYRGATHVEAVEAWFKENPSRPEVRARVEAYLGIGGTPCT